MRARSQEAALALLDDCLEPEGRARFDAWAGPALPMALPANAEQAAEVMRAAAARDLVVLPVGRGTQVDTRPLPPRADLALGTARLREPIVYEPAEGVLSASAGWDLESLEHHLTAGGHRLAPDVASPATRSLGGVFAAASHGADRLRRGPLRDQVLGLTVLGADGQLTKSGGRLVKNVTGYDLFRLHAGAHGALGVALEISMRLWPRLPDTCVLERAEAGPNPAMERALRLIEARLPLTRLLATPLEPGDSAADPASRGPWRVVCVLEGRPEALADARRRVSEVLEPDRGACGERGAPRAAAWRDATLGPRPLVVAECAPGSVATTLEHLRRAAGQVALDLVPVVEPGFARLAFLPAEGARLENHALAAFARAAAWRGARLSWPGLPAGMRGTYASEIPGLALQARLLERFDPKGRLAGGRLHPELVR
jgi:glycolate oxidase FAD binding subunit